MSADPRRQRAWSALLQGGALAGAMAWFQLEKALYAAAEIGAPVGWGPLLASMAAEAGVALGLEGLWLIAAWRQGPGWDRLWRWGFVSSHLLMYALLLMDHQFFLVTGARTSPSIVAYALTHAAMLKDLLLQTVTHAFMLRILLLPLWLLGPLWLSERRPRLAPAAWGAAPLLAAALILPRAGALRADAGFSLANSVFVEALQGFPRARWLRAREAAVSPAEVYVPPTIGPPERRPDLLIVFLESTRQDAAPPWRADPERTPNLAALAARAVAFDRAYAAVSHTSKGVVSSLCGAYPRLLMQSRESLPGGLPPTCLPEVLSEMGYRTAFMQPSLARFEAFDGLADNMGFERGIFREDLEARYGERFQPTGYFGLDEYALMGPIAEWLGEGGAQPWMLTLITATSHHPYQIPGQPPPIGPEPEAYQDAIAYVDGFVGALLEQLEAGGHLDDALIVILGDHGQAFGEHGRDYHDPVPWEEGTRIPLMLIGPEDWIGPPRRVGGIRSQLDLMPTVLEVLGAPLEGGGPGASLLTSPGRPSLVTSCFYTDHCMSLHEGDRKTIFHFGYRPTEVFDLAADPGETRDLAPGLAPETIRAAEDRMLSVKLGVERLYEEE